MVRFEVIDTGIGIANEKLEQLFKPFEQANASTTRQYGGTGLGLAITSRLAHLMGGDAGLHSEPCVGSTFWFTASLLRGRAPELSATQTVEELGQLLRQQHLGARVLLVDDDSFNREVGMEILQAVGLCVDTAVDGFDAVCQAQATMYDLVFMDVQMPVVNGLEATQRLRALPGWSEVPILALTANAFAQDRQTCMNAGMNDLLVKPINPKNLYAAVLTWLAVSAKPVEGEK
jgi:CheY-like chemotaxis protein